MTGTCFVLLAGLALASAQSVALTGCPAADVYSTTKHLADPTDCGAYYSFYPHLEHCPSGLHFNPKKQVCDTPENAGCQCSGGGGNGNNNNTGGDCPAVGSCPAVDPLDHTVHLPHQSDCSLFCRCDHGSPKLDHCPAGLHFNPKLQVCDWPNVAGCSSGGGGNGNNTGGGGNGNGGNCPAVGSCPAVDPLDHTVHLPHQSDCSLFCRCDHGSPKLDQCPAGLHFNPKLQVCDWPNVAGCSNGNNTGGGGNNTGGGGNGSGGDCPAIGSCPAVDPLDRTVHLPHQTDCSLFCRCDHGSPKLDHCPAGLNFNPKKEVCDWPADAGCVSKTA